MVVEVVEPELQGPDTVGREHGQGRREKAKINLCPSSLPSARTEHSHPACEGANLFALQCGIVQL